MLRKTLFAPLLAATALTLTVPAHASDREDRARTAIAAAEAKIETAERLGANLALPDQTAEARAALAMARERFKQDKNSQSIEEALRAQSLAEAAIGRLENEKRQALVDERAAADAHVSVASQQVADANARAASAERAAASSAIEAKAARDQAELARQQAAAAQVETTVTTQQPAAAAPRRASRTVVKKTRSTARRSAAPAPTTTTTTTVRQAVNN